MAVTFDRFDVDALLSNIISSKKQARKQVEEKKPQSHNIAHINSKQSFDEDVLLNMTCQNCDSSKIKENDGYYVCQDCGLFNELIIDSGQEWRFYGVDDSKGSDPARCDMPTNELCPTSGMGGLVGFSTKETKTTKRIRNMNFWNAIPYRESSLMDSFNNITIIAQNAGISQCIIEEAKYMYKKVTDVKSSRRTKKEAMKAGSIMLACKLKGVPRNCTEIAKMFKMKPNKTFRKSVKTFEEIWNNIKLAEQGIKPIKIANSDSEEDDSDDDSNSESDLDDDFVINTTLEELIMKDIKDIDSSKARSTPSPSIESKEFKEFKESKELQECITKLHRFSCILGLDEKNFEACRLVLIHVENAKYLDKHTPLSRTSAVLFYVNERLNLNINKHAILQTCQISEVTINKCYQKLMKYKKDLEEINFD